ncbi:helix-hairpin-helix domain-containing protein [Planomicrobium sp. CPCC 101110]|uniref:helix-hairpin-helix domain-containing protein n=1 Tax=Planomicrobium sp. CPCC 101110 TaxID=2599619 RepID=UPI0011B3EE3D|nr:helix-hairpin-helix domain-containing protein [Planomicrobium sp. CPCC 101110]TWT26205.1 competence protein ComEA [Planomicrobium sp. CPCC 101110]
MNFSKLQNKIGWLLIPTAAATILAIYFLLPQENPEAVPEASFDLIDAESPQQTPPKKPVEEIPEHLMVDIKGQVASPGVFELPAGSRLQDAIKAAGGFLPAADDRAINLAMKVQDEMSIYVPEVGEEALVPSGTPTGASDSLVNLNTATEEELMTLPGIGPSKAAAIIAYRTDTGTFQKVEDLKEVSGIGDKTFEQLAELIKVN